MAPPDEAFVQVLPMPEIYHGDWIDHNKNGQRDPYEDATLPTQQRVADLIGRMTLEEKTAQLATLYGFPRVLKDELPTAAWDQAIWKAGIGNIDEQSNGNTGAEDPLPDPTYDYPWSLHTRQINELQRWFVQSTRLGIPVDFTNEGIRGLLHTRATSFPSQLGVAATWDKDLVRAIGQVTGAEARALGYTNVYSPILDLSRDPRWGRTVETYGEDPFLVGELGVQQVLGIQQQRVVSTLKHFAVYSVPKGGRDGEARTDPHATWSEVETVLLAPFRRVIRGASPLGVMASYNDYDGVPVEASHFFLTDLLRGQLGFKGYVVSDSGAVEFIHAKHRVAPSPEAAIALAVNAGLNIRTHFTMPGAYIEPLRRLVRTGKVSLQTLDSRVADVLRVKYWQGLFDQPYHLAPAQAQSVVRSTQHRHVAERADREAIVLLQNDGTLPLKVGFRKMLVVGPLADDPGAWWSRYGPQRLDFVTPLKGLRARFPNAEIDYRKGVDAADAGFPESDIYREAMPASVRASIEDAVAAARGVDYVVAVLGEPGALCRESVSRISLDLPGYQEDLLRALHTAGVPVLVVLSSGRPMSVNFAAKHARAIVSVGYLGEGGGTALAEVLAGDVNPAGRLPITMPRSVGQIPLNFPYKPGSQDRDGGQVTGPLFPFGHGLSYSNFSYSDVKLEPRRLRSGESAKLSVRVRNDSDRDGQEVVQLYVRDDYSSVTTFERVLRGFERVTIPARQSRVVRFTLTPEHLALYDASRRWSVEPGRFTVLLGSSSTDIRQSANLTVLRPDGTAPQEAALPHLPQGGR